LTGREGHLLLFEDIIILLLVKQVGVSARTHWRDVICFYLVVNKFVSGPLSFAGTVPEVDGISGIFVEEGFNLGSK